MRDYLAEAAEVLRAPHPLRDMLARDRNGTIDAIARCLGSGDIYARKYAAFSLGQIGDPRVLDDLQGAYDQEPSGGAKEAMGAALVALRCVPPRVSSLL